MTKVAKNNSLIKDINFEIVQDWNGGFKAELDFSSLKAITKGWQLKFSAPFEIKEIYGAEVVKSDNNQYTIGNLDGNKKLAVNSTQKIIIIANDFGQPAQKATDFQLLVDNQPINQPTKPINNQTTLKDIQFEIVQDWNGGFKAELDFSSEKAITEGWQLKFSAPFEIKEIYGAEVVKSDNNQYTIGNLDWNEKLAANSTQKIIIIANDFGQPAQKATDFQLILENQPTGKPVEPIPTEPEEPVTPEQPPIPDSEPKPSENPNGTGQFRYGEALQKSFLFFEANRSGDLPNDKRIEWRSDSALSDGSDVGRDLTGGYYDAGDHVKFGLPMSANNTMLAWGGIEYESAYKQSGQWDELLEAVKWGTDYFLKAHVSEGGKTKELYVQVGDGNADHAYWGSPENMTMARPSFKIDAANPGSDAAAGTASALASASILFRGVDDAYSEKLLDNAKQLFEFADTYRGKYSDSVQAANPFYTSFSGYADELAEGAAWLYKATRDQKYLTRAEDIYDNEYGYPSDWTWMADNKSNSAAVLLAQESSDPKYKQMVEGWLENWINGTGNVQYSPGGLAWRARWGSLALASATSYLAQLYNDTVKQDSRYSDFANNQIDYILGDNPRNASYVIGFGENYPLQPHHRAASGNAPYGQPSEHILFGALVGGPGSTNDFDYNDDRNDWVTNEVGTGYNAPLTSALIQQYNNFGGDPLSNAELDALPGIVVAEV